MAPDGSKRSSAVEQGGGEGNGMERVTREEAAPGPGAGAPELMGESRAWIEVVRSLPRIAASGLPVLVIGETGSGKELIARAVHALSPRRRQGFVAHNCGATPDSLIENELFGHARGAFTGAVADRGGLFERAPRISDALAGWLLRSPWPGNVRELQNGCAYAVTVAGARGAVGPEHWPEPVLLPAALPAAGGAEGGLHAETRALEERRL